MIKIRHTVGAVLLFINRLIKIIRGSRDFYELEERVHELSQRVCSQILVWALEQIDTRLMNERDRQEWEVVGFRGKDGLSTFGESTYRRRLYKNKKTGETKYFLDKLLGWPVCEKNPVYFRRSHKKNKRYRKKRLIKLLSYLTQNWEGITTSPGVERLGAIEGQIQLRNFFKKFTYKISTRTKCKALLDR